MAFPLTNLLFPRLDADSLAYLFSTLSLPALCRLRSTCKDADRLVATELDFRFTKALAMFVERPDDFRGMLRSTDSVVSGSVVVWLAGGTDFRPNDLDVYSTEEFAEKVFACLSSQGYKSVGQIDPYFPDYRGGIRRIVRYGRGPLSIDVVISHTQSATLPIVYFWATPAMAFFGGDGISILYPRLLEDNQGLLNPGRFFADPDRLAALIDKYERRGYRIKEEEKDFVKAGDIVPACKARASATCPFNTRFIGDRFCLQVAFGSVDARRTVKPFSGTLATLTNVWWRGGEGCGGCSASYGDVEFDAWTQSADIVGL